MRGEILSFAFAGALLCAGCPAGTPLEAAPDAGAAWDAGPHSDAGFDGDAGPHSDAGLTEPAIWSPAPGTSWQWQLDQPIDTSLDVQAWDVDLFETPEAALAALRAEGRKVICYFSAGSREEWRPDADQFDESDLGSALEGWPGERWLRVQSPAVRDLMRARLDLAVQKGCDGVEPDNVDGYANDNGVSLSAADQLDYNRFLAREAHARRLSVGLKNDLDQVAQLVADFDWALNEECFAYDECALLRPFIDAGKAVFHVEYVDRREDGAALAAQVCGQPSVAGFSTLVKTWELDSWRIACP